MMIFLVLLLILPSCKTASSSSSQVESEAKRVSSESGKTTTQKDSQTIIKKTTSQNPSKITTTKDQFEIIRIPGKDPISVLKEHTIQVRDLGKKTVASGVEKDQRLKQEEELRKKQEDEARKKAAAEAKRLSEPVLPSCGVSGWLWFVVIAVVIVGVLRFVGSKLPFPFNILAKKKE